LVPSYHGKKALEKLTEILYKDSKKFPITKPKIMSTFVNDDVYPSTAVVFILARWGQTWYSGSGVIIGKNDILTAAHVIYNSNLGRLADEILIYPSYNPLSADSNYYRPVWIEYFPGFDPDGDGKVYIGDSNVSSGAGTEIDIALLSTSVDLARFGSFGVDPNFPGGAVSVLGYPGLYENRLVLDSGTVRKLSLDNSFQILNDLEVNPGNSGGPIYYINSDGPYVVGLVSTGIGATNIEKHWGWLSKSILTNDKFLSSTLQIPTYTVQVDGLVKVKEGTSAKFLISTTNVLPFTELSYTITGVQLNDLVGTSLTGTIVINQEGKASFQIPTAKDSLAEGVEVLKLSVSGASASISIEDTVTSLPLEIQRIYTSQAGIRTVYDSSIAVWFNQSIKFGAGTAELRLGSPTGELIESFSATSNGIWINNGQVIVIDPKSNFKSDSVYFLVMKNDFARGLTSEEPLTSLNYSFFTEKLNQSVAGTSKSEYLIGGSGSDIIQGFAGNDVIDDGYSLSDYGNDTISGGDGDDTIHASGGSDIINGDYGNDVLYGGFGNDYADGGSGWDSYNCSHLWAKDLSLTFFGGAWIISPKDLLSPLGTDTLVNFEAISIADRAIRIESKPHSSYANVPDSLYQFFITAFGAAPGVNYMDQLVEAYQAGLSVRQIVNIFTTKTQFTSIYPLGLTKSDLANSLVNNIVKSSATSSAKSSAANEIVSALNSGMTIGDVVFNVFNNLGSKSQSDPVWGGTSVMFKKQISVAKYYTDVMNQSTMDLDTLRSVIRIVDQNSDVSSDLAVAKLIGVALLTGGGG
jgi:V8-like Glu-specific endopeptidase